MWILLLQLVIWAESSGNHKAVSTVNAIGLMQVTEIGVQEVRNQYGLYRHQCPDLFNPLVNVEVGSHLLSFYLGVAKGDIRGGLSLYNGGYRAYRNYRKGTLKKMPETYNYVAKICDKIDCDEEILVAPPFNIHGSY